MAKQRVDSSERKRSQEVKQKKKNLSEHAGTPGEQKANKIEGLKGQ